MDKRATLLRRASYTFAVMTVNVVAAETLLNHEKALFFEMRMAGSNHKQMSWARHD